MYRSILKTAAGVLCAVFVLFMPSASAATATTTFPVTATVGSSCSVVAANLDFGTYDPLALLAATATTTVTVQCTLLTASIGLDAGTGAGATVATRKMTKAADTLAYSLYQDVAHLLVWGNTIGTDTVGGVGTGLAVPHTVYGQIPAGQNVNTGVYNDTITVSVDF
ncbi:MAG: spore coat protein [Betaproteobacteria bacterium HGW-Betaproteobacteria-11]|nr:MAG: spore coat protein [Betaproteobacteria bacterium HGW-Betaproteobacteria-11]